jgi:hypothetical protein
MTDDYLDKRIKGAVAERELDFMEMTEIANHLRLVSFLNSSSTAMGSSPLRSKMPS